MPAPKNISRPSNTAKQLKKLTASGKVAKPQVSKMQSEVEETAKSKLTKEDHKLKNNINETEVIIPEASEAPSDQKSLEPSNIQESTENGVKEEDRNRQHENIENGVSNVSSQLEHLQNGNGEVKEVENAAQEEPNVVNLDEKIEKEDQQSESHTDTESYVVESTTSEISEISEQPSEPKEHEKYNEAAILETPCVSYDSSITLKSVQIKLNDCLKDNSKSAEENNESTGEPLYKDLSFGKTLRTISGRRSLSRLRHVTLREHNRLSPNSSLFVNTSSMSQDEDLKILRHRVGLSDTISSNGTPSERKRKLYPEESNVLKKPKIESQSSFFNSSLELLKSFRRPVSTHNAYKFQTDNLNLSEKRSSNLEFQDETPNANKWCVIM